MPGAYPGAPPAGFPFAPGQFPPPGQFLPGQVPMQISVPAPAAAAAAGPAKEWTEHTAPDGRKYYFNNRSKVSSWSKPEELLTPEVGESVCKLCNWGWEYSNMLSFFL